MPGKFVGCMKTQTNQCKDIPFQNLLKEKTQKIANQHNPIKTIQQKHSKQLKNNHKLPKMPIGELVTRNQNTNPNKQNSITHHLQKNLRTSIRPKIFLKRRIQNKTIHVRHFQPPSSNSY